MTVVVADCIEHMRTLDEHSVDAVVCDPPYGLEFMGKEWDRPWAARPGRPAGAGMTRGGFAGGNGYATRLTPSYGKAWQNKRCVKCGHIASGGSPCVCPDPEWVIERGNTARPMQAFQAWCESWAIEALRVLKPGGHLLAFGGTRTYHRLAAGIEDAGFEIRDSILSVSGGGDAAEQSSGLLAWMYGSGRPGFPKSMNLDNLRGTVTCGCDETPEHDLPRLRHSDVPASVGTKGGQGQVLHEGVQEQGASANRSVSAAGCSGGAERFVEGWGDVLAEGGQLPADQVRASAGMGASDGSQGRLHHGAPAVDGETLRVPADEDGGGASPRPRSDEQRPEQPRTVADEREPQGGGAWPHCGRCGKPRLPRGLGTALKPAFEPVVVARKPLTGTVAATVLAHGTGALNIDGCRIGTDGGTRKGSFPNQASVAAYGDGLNGACDIEEIGKGRWPANVMLDEEAAGLLDEQTGELTSGANPSRRGSDKFRDAYGDFKGQEECTPARGADSGGASRFFLTVSPDTLCVLCALPCAPTATDHSNLSAKNSGSAVGPVPASGPRDSEDKSAPSTGPANTVGQASSTTPATVKGVTARTDAQAKLAARIVQLARSAESLCDSCATATAQSVAATLHDPTQGSHPGPVSTRERRQRILSRSLALIAAGWESTGITPTTAALSSSFGSALHVTESDTAESSSEFDRTRFRYQSKASSAERNAGLDGFEERARGNLNQGMQNMGKRTTHFRNAHPTVKPVELMRWLIRLVTPPGGLVLDPFTGSGTTGVAAHLEGVEFLGIEREAEYAEIARARIEWWRANTDAGAPTDAVLKVDRDPAQLDLLGGEAA